MLLVLTVRTFSAASIVQSVQRLATGWIVQESNPAGIDILGAVQTPLEAYSAPLYNGYRDFPRNKTVGAWC
jgi:hypothetical protein